MATTSKRGLVCRSGFEARVADSLDERGIEYGYESVHIEYHRKPNRYTPDWALPNGVLVESKGRFTAADRSKILLVKMQNPDIDLRMLFQAPNNRISPKSKTTYAIWCEKHGIPWAKGPEIPQEWIDE